MKKCFCLSAIFVVSLVSNSCKDKNSGYNLKSTEIGAVTNNISQYSFKPILKGTVSCFVTVNDQTGDVDVAIKNVLTNNITFTKPRIISGLGVNEKANGNTNPIIIDMSWRGGADEKQSFARLIYATYEGIEVKDQLVTLKPNEISHIKLKLENTLVERRCNLVPFSECFSGGKTKFSLVVCLLGHSDGEEDVKIAVSNTNTIHRKYIY